MFDIGFWELTLIGVVALLVIGPERLPKVARTAGFWFGRMTRFINNVKSEIDKEMKAEELKKILEQQANSSGVHEMIDEGKSALEQINTIDSKIREESSASVIESQEPPAESEPVDSRRSSSNTQPKQSS
jgi:sec-independent protein translocase protein TatB